MLLPPNFLWHNCTMEKLTVKEDAFCLEYTKQGGDAFGNAAAAYRVAFNAHKSKANNVYRRAYALLKKKSIQARIEDLRKIVVEETKFSIQDVLKQWVTIVTTDTNEIVQHRRDACRFCYGLEHNYQWVDENEWADACSLAIARQEPNPDNVGGFGFTPNRQPHRTCPKCFGEGIGRIYIADTRYLSPEAKILFTGIEQTRNGGVKISFRNKDNALESIAKFLGMFKNEQPDGKGSPVNVYINKDQKISDVTSDPITASTIYADIIGV